MKRILFSSVVVLAACGGGAAGPDAKPPVTPTATNPMPSTADAVPTRPVTPESTFRDGYSNPGGMWMPSQMSLGSHVENFKKMGAALDAKTLSDPLSAPLGAIVSLGGCTGSFVSPEGLVVTNHHCVQGALQLNSTPQSNLVENGFLAKTKAEEKTAGPAQRVFVAQAFKDITKEMTDGIDKVADPSARKKESEKRQKQQVAACEKDRPGIKCQVSSFFRGGQYQLIEMLEIRDIRLVYVPARGVGNFGGEIDNWEWPRHTGDWSFYRAYVGKDGKPADYSPDNVPFKPKHFLKVAQEGLHQGDMVMVTGYPGVTNRTTTASQIKHNVEWGYPYRIAYLKERYGIAESHLKDGGETAIKATVMKQSIQNGLEKTEGILQGLTKNPELMQQKDDLDKKAKAWAASPGHEKHKAGIEKLEKMLDDQRKVARADFDRGVAFSGSSLLAASLTFLRWADERPKADADRKPGFQDRDMPRALAGQKQFLKGYDRTLDKANFRLALTRAVKLPEADRKWLPTLLGVAAGTKIDDALIDKTLDAWYKEPSIEDEKTRTEIVQKGKLADLKAMKDPFMQAAVRIWPTYMAEEKDDDKKAGDLMLLTPMYVESMKEALGGVLAPDANSTLRVTYGTVRSLKPGSTDAKDLPFTFASQIPAKDTGKDPFNSPKPLLEAIKAKKYGPYADPMLKGELPVDFTSDLDITGGNSGSPTLNHRGELVGLAFDGNKEGLASDVVFNGKTTRTIHVDTRYMLFVMDAIDQADHLVKELGFEPKL